jgi:hypothetical protein
MTFTDLLQLSAAVLASVGGAGAIIFGLSSWLGKVWAERLLSKEKQKYAEDLESFKSRLTLSAESYKVKLKKSEFIFSREFDAASALVSLIRDISPQVTRPEMEWYDACDEMATAFDSIEKRLHEYLRSHGAIVPDEVRELVSRAFGLASHNKFSDGPDVSSEANEAAKKLFEALTSAETKMVTQVRSQVAF